MAPLYRATTGALTLLIPVVAAYAWRSRSNRWLLLLGLCVIAMMLTLQRGSAVSGFMLFMGILVVNSGKKITMYLLALIGVYFVGSAFYFVLSIIGVQGFQSSAGTSTSILVQVAAGAPDVSDQLTFLQSWLARPEYTHGLTFVGGLIPGNFHWNPAVWGLSITNPGVDVGEISSGGYRLPAPIWGLVSFGWPGVVIVSLMYGFLSALISSVARRKISRDNLQSAVIGMITYGALIGVFANFYALGYLAALNLGIVLILFYLRAGLSPSALSLPPVRDNFGHSTTKAKYHKNASSP